MRRRFLTLFTLFFFLGAHAQECPVVPLPASAQLDPGEFLLDRQTVIVPADTSLYALAWKLQKMLFEKTGYPLAVQPGQDAGGTAILLRRAATPSGKEAYRLSISSRQALIEAGDEAGVFYGIISFLQLARQYRDSLTAGGPDTISLPCWQIEDAPHYSWRGIMLDEARHFFGKEKVKQLLDQMAYYKLNRFHWHLTDVQGWRITIRKYPKLTLVGGIGNRSDAHAPARYYTQADIAEIILYARQLQIEIIPEIDMPGHAGAANRAYPRYKGMHPEGRSAYTFNPGKEGTYGYLSDILKEVDVMFPFQMIHLGGDEVSMGNKLWKEEPAVRELMKKEHLDDLEAVEHYFIRRMADSVNQLRNKVLVWDEAVNAGLSPENTMIFWWRPDKPEQLTRALENGYRTILCPRAPLYFSLVQDNAQRWGKKLDSGVNDLESVYSFPGETLPIPEKSRHLVAGLQANVWTEFIQNGKRLDFMLFPRMIALAETAWSDPEQKNYLSFLKRLPVQLRQLDDEGIYYYNPFQPSLHPEPPGGR